MKTLMRLWRQLRWSWRHERNSQDLDRELEAHIALEIRQRIDHGETPEEADRAARKTFGNHTRIAEQTRDVWRFRWLEEIWHDLRYGARRLLRSPGFTTIAVASLALGIGANTAIFSLIDSVLLASLPVEDPDRLVMLTEPDRRGMSSGFPNDVRDLLTYDEFQQFRDQSEVFSNVMALEALLLRLQARVNRDAATEEVAIRMVSGDYFETLGIRPRIGRTFTAPDADVEDNAPFAIISDDFWQRRFGGREDVIGLPIEIHDAVFTIVGVAPQSFFGVIVGQRPDVWMPLSMQPTVLPGNNWLHGVPGVPVKVMWLQVFARLKAGVAPAQAEAATNVLFQQGLTDFYSPFMSGADLERALQQKIVLTPATHGVSALVQQLPDLLFLLAAAAGIVLLIACANLGNLLLARTIARAREISVCLGLGSGRQRVIRQLLIEGLLLAVIGGMVGIPAAIFMHTSLLSVVPGSIVLPFFPDKRVLLFAFALTAVAGLVLTLFPAMRATRIKSGAGFKEQGRGTVGSAAWVRLGRLIVVGQLALSLPLLVGAGLLQRTLNNLLELDLGYPKENLLLVNADLAPAGYAGPRLVAMTEQILREIRALPGVEAATFSTNGLFSGTNSTSTIEVAGYETEGEDPPILLNDHVGPGYFSAMEIPLLAGREIGEQDRESTAPVCMINDAFRRRFFEDRDPIGRSFLRVAGQPDSACRIVGVVPDFRIYSFRNNVPEQFYVAMSQGEPPTGFPYFEIRTAVPPTTLVQNVRQLIAGIDPDIEIRQAAPLTESYESQVGQDRFLATLALAFGSVALVLSVIGLYGILSYGVALRTGEIGIRKALGAQNSAVVGMILRETGVLLAVGLALGVILAAFGTRLISSRLFGLAPSDPASYGMAVAILAIVGIAATCIPAYRALSVDPMAALREE